MFQIELRYPLKMALRVRAGRRVPIRRPDAVHSNIPVDLDIPDKGVGALQIDTGPMDDRPDLDRQQPGALEHP